MKTIGITGGVGSGKSSILTYLEQNYNCIILKADEIANQLKLPGRECYQTIILLLGNEIIGEDGLIDNTKMAEKLFGDRSLLTQTEAIIHPAVKKIIKNRIALEKKKNGVGILFVEAALLIEDYYDEILDELWYIYADEETRKDRLIQSRGYTEAKIKKIMSEQLPDEMFRNYCKVIIDNSGTMDETMIQIDCRVREHLCRK